ncbi:amino acid adenylation domain-containing protein [Nocardia terpenica]|uniref:amino acid adenylation domain-containing protein n=1 Tax=Nocardia terpenica TaxID=455432 RepID=UPI002FE2693D
MTRAQDRAVPDTGADAVDHPLSGAQVRWWVAQQLYPEVPNTVALYLDLLGPLEVPVLEACAERAARELQSPWVRFRLVDGRPRQFLDPNAFGPLRHEDLRDRPDPVETASKAMAADHGSPLDLLTDRLTTAALYRVAPEHHLLYLRSHHIVLDGVGAASVLRRTAELYLESATAAKEIDGAGNGFRAGSMVSRLGVRSSARPLSIAELLEDERAYQDSTRMQADREYWREQLREVGETDGFAGRRAAPAAMPYRVEGFVSARTARLFAAARGRTGATFPELTVAAFACYLAAVTGSDEVVLTLPVAARPSAALRRSAGSLSNAVPLRATGIRGGTVRAAVEQVRARVVGALRHQRYRYEDMQRDRGESHVARGGFGPVVNVLGFIEPLRLGRSTAQVRLLALGPVEDLLLNGYQLGAEEGSISIDMQANPALYSEATLAWHHERFLDYLERFLAADAEQVVRELDPAIVVPTVAAVRTDRLLPDLLRTSLIRQPNTPAPHDSGMLLAGISPMDSGQKHAGITSVGPIASVGPSAEAIALQDGDRTWTYRQLDEDSSRWARELIESGAGPGTFILLAIPRSAESVLALWAVAKTGAAFVPVDPADPARRLAAMASDSGARVGMTIAAHRPDLPAEVAWLVLDDPSTAERVRRRPSDPIGDDDRHRTLRPDHPAYLIYTSGTTGTPKGVAVTHRGLGSLTDHIVERYAVDRDSRVLHAHVPSFDAHLLELLAAFAAGARLVVEPPDVVAGAPLRRLLTDAEITHFLTTPAVLATLVPEDVPALRVAVVGGEACPADLVRRWASALRLFNGYGPTETTVMATQSEALTVGTPAPIGRALPGIHTLVLDPHLRPVPPGARGELYIGGPALAAGYLGHPATTAERFVANPFGVTGKFGERLYRTGDLVRADVDGTLEFLGRADDQVSVRGRRVEPAEVEAALVALPQIAQAVVGMDQLASGPRLIGYVVAADDTPLDTADLVRRLRDSLPAALVPAQLIALDRLPVTAHGKVDRSALPAPAFAERPYRVPETALQRMVAERFAAATGAARVGLDDDFFELGGNSLLGVPLSADLAAATGRPVTVRWLYTAPTVRELADRIAHDDGTGADDALGVLLTLRRGGAEPPLFCVHSAVPLAWCYSGLARYVTDRPVLGLQAVTGRPRATIDELAEGYVAEILRRQPDGPYHLLGWSLGGQIAHAIAVRLRERGCAVAVLAMLDSVVFPEDMPPPPTPRMRDLLTHLLGDEPEDADALADLTAEQAAAELAAAGASFGTGLTADQLTRLHRGYADGVRLSHGYRPGRFDGDLLYFSATRGVTESFGADLWRPYVAGELVEHPVDATHAQLTNSDVVAVIGPVLAAHLEAVR